VSCARPTRTSSPPTGTSNAPEPGYYEAAVEPSAASRAEPDGHIVRIAGAGAHPSPSRPSRPRRFRRDAGTDHARPDVLRPRRAHRGDGRRTLLPPGVRAGTGSAAALHERSDRPGSQAHDRPRHGWCADSGNPNGSTPPPGGWPGNTPSTDWSRTITRW
jgi:hypothetical protein